MTDGHPDGRVSQRKGFCGPECSHGEATGDPGAYEPGAPRADRPALPSADLPVPQRMGMERPGRARYPKLKPAGWPPKMR